jgi:hypothetical protein
MTTYDKVTKTLYTLQGAVADLETAMLQSEDSNKKQLYEQMFMDAKEVMVILESRVNTIEQEEPQYREE